MAGRRTPEEIQRILNQPNPLVPTETIGVRLGAFLRVSFAPISYRLHVCFTSPSRRFAAKLTLKNTWVSLPPRGSARPA